MEKYQEWYTLRTYYLWRIAPWRVEVDGKEGRGRIVVGGIFSLFHSWFSGPWSIFKRFPSALAFPNLVLVTNPDCLPWLNNPALSTFLCKISRLSLIVPMSLNLDLIRSAAETLFGDFGSFWRDDFLLRFPCLPSFDFCFFNLIHFLFWFFVRGDKSMF